MKKVFQFLMVAAVISSSSGAYAQFAAAGPAAPGGPAVVDGPGSDGCYFVHLNDGKKATLRQILKAGDAEVLPINRCESHEYDLRFHVQGQQAAFMKNQELRKLLRKNGFFPDNVIGVRNQQGKLVVYVHAIGA